MNCRMAALATAQGEVERDLSRQRLGGCAWVASSVRKSGAIPLFICPEHFDHTPKKAKQGNPRNCQASCRQACCQCKVDLLMLVIEAGRQGQLRQDHPRSNNHDAEEELSKGISLQPRTNGAVMPEGIGVNGKTRTLGQCLTFRDCLDIVSTLKTALALMSRLLSLEVVECPRACVGI